MINKYADMVESIREIADVTRAEAVLGWDQQTYMPPKGNDARSRQMAALSGIAHEKTCSPALGDLLEKCLADPEATAEEKIIAREFKRDRDKAVKAPGWLVKKLAETAGKAHEVWVEARAKSDFNIFAPLLSELIDLSKQKADFIGYPSDGVPYDGLIDAFEPGATVKTLTPVIEKTREIIVPAVKALAEAPKRPKVEILRRNYPAKAQEALGLYVMEKMGFDMQAGRLDASVHPFTTNFDPMDVRLTTRYDENWLPGSLFGVIHECGHGLYEQGFDPAYAGTPLSDAISLGIHESQSRFWENQVGRGKPFWTFLYPKLVELFPGALSDVSFDDFYFAINNVEPSLIRVEADEVTYNLHIIVRYEIEQIMFDGQTKLSELPGIWNDKMKEYLGVTPPDDKNGILQDIHWSFGGFGYFPTYLLGNLYAAQWMNTLSAAMPNLDALIEKGELLPIRNWLKEKIHVVGRRLSAAQLVQEVSGEPLNPAHFERYLKSRFCELYNVKW